MDTDTSVVMAIGKVWGRDWVEVGKPGEMGTSVIVSTIKIKLKQINIYIHTSDLKH